MCKVCGHNHFGARICGELLDAGGVTISCQCGNKKSVERKFVALFVDERTEKEKEAQEEKVKANYYV